jgi:hypothetical protein
LTLLHQSEELRKQLSWFLKNLELQLTDLDLIKQGVELKFYWDTAHVVRAVLGMADFYKPPGNRFKRDDFESKQTLAACLASAGWLLPMRLLPPHQAEFYNRFKARFGLGHERVPPGGADQFFRDTRLGSSFSLREFHEKSHGEQSKIVKQYAGKAKLLFKAVECVKGNWEERLVDFYRQKLLNLDSADEIDYNEVFQDENFIKTREFFDRKRDPRQFGLNNITDASALCLVHQQVAAYKTAATRSLPRLYEYSNLFREAMLEWEDSPQEKKAFDPLRDVDYYLFRGMFNPPPDLVRDGSHKTFIDALVSVKDKVKEILEASDILTPELINDIVNIDGKPLLIVITELQEYSFLEKVWLPYVAHKAVSKAAKDYVHREDVVDNKEFEDTVRKSLEELSRVLESGVRQYKRMSDLYIEVETHIDRFQRKFHSVRKDAPDVFSFFGLQQFGIPEEYHGRTCEFVHLFLGGDQSEVEIAKTRLCRLYRDAETRREENESRAVAACVLWILQMHSHIRHLSGKGERTSWFLSLTAANAIKLKDFHGAVSIIAELEKRYHALPDNHAKAQEAIRLAYLYFHLWRDGGGVVQWRAEKSLEKSYSREKIDSWIGSSIHYARQAYSANHPSVASGVYALNVYLYYVTEGAEDREFNKITKVAGELLRYEIDPVWQYRFDDTMARYFHRQSTLAPTFQDKKNRLEKAVEHIARAGEESHGNPDVESYDSILANAKIELSQEADYRAAEPDQGR